MPNPSNVQEILARVPAWQGRSDFQVERIAGLSNVNYLVTTQGEKYVLRVSGQNTERLGINRDHEATALRAASQAGIAPEMVALLQPEGHLVTRWVEGKHWSVEEFRTPEHVRLLTQTVKRLHGLPPNGAIFSPFQRVESFLQTALRYGVNPPSNFEKCQESMRVVLSDQQNDHSDWRSFCHNDLVSCNYLYVASQNAIKVLDWEFAGLGDLYYDLATVVYTHDSDGPIPPELEDVMLETYFGSITAQQRRRLAGMKFMLMLFTGCWGLAQAGMVSAGLIPAVEDFDYLEFAKTLFDHDIRDLQAQL